MTVRARCVDRGIGHREAVTRFVDRADSVHERGGEGLGVGRDELVVDAHPVYVGGEERAAHEQRRAEQLLAVVAGVGLVHEVPAVRPTIEPSQAPHWSRHARWLP